MGHMKFDRIRKQRVSRGYLDGQMLVAMPGMPDKRFQKSLIYLCAHSAEGAMGIIVNHAAVGLRLPELLVQLKVVDDEESVARPARRAEKLQRSTSMGTIKSTADRFLKEERRSNRPPALAEDIHVLKGGPVEPGRGFVLHSADIIIDSSTLPIDADICLTATVDILRAIAKGQGPHDAVLALGYAGWGAGQLEQEIQSNGWLHCDADHDLVFGDDFESKYHRAMHKIGVDPALLSADAGRA
jgi:putative transcriptional regulator